MKKTFALIASALLFCAPLAALAVACPVACSNTCLQGTVQNNSYDCGATSALCCIPEAAAVSCADQAQTLGSSGSCKSQCANTENAVQSTDCTAQNQYCCIVVTNGAAPTSTGTTLGSTTKLYDPLGGLGLVGIISRFIQTFLGVVGAIALIVFVYAGVMYMTAGSSDRIKKSMDAMKYAVLGLFIILFAYIITSVYLGILTTAPPVVTGAGSTTLPK